MKNIIIKVGIVIATVFLGFQSFQVVNADHHKENKYSDGEYGKYYYSDDEYGKYKDYDDDDYKKYKKHDDDDDWYDEGNYYGQSYSQTYWNIWTRDAVAGSDENLPFQEAQTVTFNFDGKSEKLFVLPSNGQLLVSGEKLAKLLNVKAKFYKESRILELSNDKEELIVRAGTNASYENMIKTPMPAKAMYYEKTVYLPISVICNAFEYRVNWDNEKQVMNIENFY